jgi:pimeloyl-ACP methyl ester carboxylesterase
MRGFGDSDKPDGTVGYDARALAEEGRALIAQLGFGKDKPLIHAAHDMGALPALIWCADHAQEVAALIYIEAPVMLGQCPPQDHRLYARGDGQGLDVVVDSATRTRGSPSGWSSATSARS